jgi:hypothetical protein
MLFDKNDLTPDGQLVRTARAIGIFFAAPDESEYVV